MSWDYKLTDQAFKELKKLGPEPSKRIVRFLKTRVRGSDDPRRFGKSLGGDLKGVWRYRVDDYRVLCRIEDENLIVVVVAAGNRRDVYE